ncbi:hypothetical protein OEZ86_010537 [Tetradesmus obliquus]|nr:hypothetical protein OEZ86_010537 [Tetradesmus obliquus]
MSRLEALASHSKVCTAERPHKPLAKPHPAAAAAAAASGHICGDMCLDASGPTSSPTKSGSGGPGSSSSKVKSGAAAASSSGGGHICGDMCLDTSGPRSSPTKSGPGGPGRMPRALVCYLCGGQFFAKSDSGSGGPSKMPQALVCYLCGGQFFAKRRWCATGLEGSSPRAAGSAVRRAGGRHSSAGSRPGPAGVVIGQLLLCTAVVCIRVALACVVYLGSPRQRCQACWGQARRCRQQARPCRCAEWDAAIVMCKNVTLALHLQGPEALSGVLRGVTRLPATGRALQEFNDAAFDTFNSASLVPCKACGRTFRPEALAHHAKHCTPDKPMRKPH